MVFTHIHAVDLSMVEQILARRRSLHPLIPRRELVAGGLRQIPLHLTGKDAPGRDAGQLRQIAVFRFRIGLLRQYKDRCTAHRQCADHQ